MPWWGLLADLAVVLHLAFIVFVAAGGLLVLRWRRLMWLHLAAVAWGGLVELAGWWCPLTFLENRLRSVDGEGVYDKGFVDHYVVPLVYPETLSRPLQIGLGLLVLVGNGVFYGWLMSRCRRSRIDLPGDQSQG